MQLNWIKITERAAEGIKIINQLDDDVFVTVVQYVRKNMAPDENDDQDQGLEELEKLVRVERADFLLLIKTLSYILKRTSTFVMRPTQLQQELRDKLQLNDNKVDAIMKMWMKTMKPIFDNMQAGAGTTTAADGANELQNVSWKLKVQLSSEAQQRERTPIAHLQLTTRHGTPTNLEVNHTELLGLYNQLEAIQGELDALRNK